MDSDEENQSNDAELDEIRSTSDFGEDDGREEGAHKGLLAVEWMPALCLDVDRV